MNQGVFCIGKRHCPKEGMTISTKAFPGTGVPVHIFSLGKGTDISAETYDCPVLYLAAAGKGNFYAGNEGLPLAAGAGDLLAIPGKTLCGAAAAGDRGFVYTELLLEKESNMNQILKTGEVFRLKDIIEYEKDSIANMDLASNEKMKFMILSFDDGCALSPHRAPGDAIVFALEGQAVINCEGQEYTVKEGENFRFEKNGLHSVTAQGRFKMALLLVYG